MGTVSRNGGTFEKRHSGIGPIGLGSWLTFGGIQGGRIVSNEPDFWLANQLDTDTETGNSAGEKVCRERQTGNASWLSVTQESSQED